MKMDLISTSYDHDSNEKQSIAIKHEYQQPPDEDQFYLLKERPGAYFYQVSKLVAWSPQKVTAVSKRHGVVTIC
jgi:hypothetical protein